MLGTVFGADDFLPCLTWCCCVVIVATLQVDTDYMMELLDPLQLQGEGRGYTHIQTHKHESICCTSLYAVDICK